MTNAVNKTFVSSACVKHARIGESVRHLAEAGFANIELSGGTQPYAELEYELLALQDEFGLTYLCHNYFPPPPKPFVVNLASLDDEVYDLSIEHIERALRLSRRLGAMAFGFHAGFRINIPVNQIGKSIDAQRLFDRQVSLDRFAETLSMLIAKHPDMLLYVENNVLSQVNHTNFGGDNPFFVVDAAGVRELESVQSFNLLLDVAHLKVSCQTLGLDFEQELGLLMPASDYIHISDNDGSADTNGTYLPDSDLHRIMQGYDLTGKVITLETYGSMENLRLSYETAESLRNA